MACPGTAAERRQTTMKKLLVLAALARVFAAGTATVLTLYPQPAVADCAGSNCSEFRRAPNRTKTFHVKHFCPIGARIGQFPRKYSMFRSEQVFARSKAAPARQTARRPVLRDIRRRQQGFAIKDRIRPGDHAKDCASRSVRIYQRETDRAAGKTIRVVAIIRTKSIG